MPNDDPPPPPPQPSPEPHHASSIHQPKPAPSRSLFSIPALVKRIFDKFPLVTYASNSLPSRAPKSRGQNVLHIFASSEEARDGRPSFNPVCLKWQAYLRFNDIDVTFVSSNNHASPSGSLPFLLPAGSHSEAPIPSNKLRKWVSSQKSAGAGAEKKTAVQDPVKEDVRYEAYTSLLSTPIRKAWLYQLYLQPPNTALLHTLYITRTTSNPFVQWTLAHQLRRAAETELLRSFSTPTIAERDILHQAGEAFAALSTLLCEDEWFFGHSQPGIFDAGVFGYTQLLLDAGLRWGAGGNALGEMVRGYGNLVRHREQIARLYF